MAATLALVVVLVALGVRRDVPLAELMPRYANAASRFEEVDGVTLHYRDERRDEGPEEESGPPLVLLHGTLASLHTWDGWVSRLSSHRRIVRLDLPGYGLTGPAADKDYTSARYARTVVALLDHLGIAKADIAGNSLGGRIALRLALDHPTRVRRLVLVDAAGMSGQPPTPIARLARVPVLNGLLRWVTPKMLVTANVKQVYGEPSRITPEVIDRYDDLLRREGNRQATLDRQNGPAEPNLDDRLGEIHTPVLIEWGARDRWIPLALGQRLHDGIAGSRMVIYGDVGHMPMEEAPGPSSADADAFLREAASP